MPKLLLLVGIMTAFEIVNSGVTRLPNPDPTLAKVAAATPSATQLLHSTSNRHKNNVQTRRKSEWKRTHGCCGPHLKHT